MLTVPDDEAMGATNTKSISQAQGQPATEAGEEQSEEPPATSSTTTSGRRRGRRKVMKKKMLKDEEGYLGMYFTAAA